MNASYYIIHLELTSCVVTWPLAPHYLQQLLQEYHPSRLLRSSTKQLLLTPHNVVTKSYGQRSFQYSIPHLWNQLPDDIRECSSLDQFKSLLKSHLLVK